MIKIFNLIKKWPPMIKIFNLIKKWPPMIKIFSPWATAQAPKRPLVNGCSCCWDSYFWKCFFLQFWWEEKILFVATFFHFEWYGLGFGYEYTVARGTLMIQRNITYWHNCHHHHNHCYHYHHTVIHREMRHIKDTWYTGQPSLPCVPSPTRPKQKPLPRPLCVRRKKGRGLENLPLPSRLRLRFDLNKPTLGTNLPGA